MRAVIIFDADNTLWDTNAVFRQAQLDMLRVFGRAGLLADEEHQLGVLRAVDRELISQLRRFEYDFRVLSTALAIYYSGVSSIEEAVRRTVRLGSDALSSSLLPLVEEAYQSFEEGLRAIPPLFPDTEATLTAVHASKADDCEVAVLVFSDGNPSRLDRILHAHNIRSRRIFDEIIIGTKSAESFEEAKLSGLRHLPNRGEPSQTTFVMIGDSLQRDVKFGNQAGFITVYKPADFLGQEKPREPDEEPDFTISTLNDLLPILHNMGLSADQTVST